MIRKTTRFALLALACVTLTPACVSPFSDHAKDVRARWSERAHNAHRRYDKYVLDLDWDDPYRDWHDESYASSSRRH